MDRTPSKRLATWNMKHDWSWLKLESMACSGNCPFGWAIAQAYRSPSLSSSSYFSWVAHSPETRMPSYYAEKRKQILHLHKFPMHHERTQRCHLSWLNICNIFYFELWLCDFCSLYDNKNKELFKCMIDYLQCSSQLWTSKVPTSSMSHRPCQWPWYQHLPAASATVLPTEAPDPKRRGTSMKGPDCENVGRGQACFWIFWSLQLM